MISMRIPDGPLLDWIEKVGSWISWGNRESNYISLGFKMTGNLCKICFHCERDILHSCQKYQCQSCGRLLCGNCVQGLASLDVVTLSRLKATTEVMFDIKSCKLCFELGPLSESAQRCRGKVYPSESPRQSPEPPSRSFSGEKFDGHSPHVLNIGHDLSFSNHPSPVSVHHSPSRSDEDEEEDSVFNESNRYFGDTSDIDSICGSARHEFYSFTSVGSSPSDSPSRIHTTSNRVGHYVQQDQGGTPRSQNGQFNQELAYLDGDAKNVEGLSIFQNKSEKSSQSFDFETDGPIWFPPPADGVDDDAESSFFTYDDEDDEVGDLGAIFFSNAGCDNMFLAKEKQNVDHKETLRSVVQGYFRALVSELLQGQGLIAKENCAENWLDPITTIAWQAACYIKPDTSRGGSMDPCDYVKVKCVASGIPSESKLIKGVVCTKNIKHKRMTSQFNNTRLLLLGGALEYQRAPNQLTSFNTLLQQENDYLRMIVSKIEALRPNVLLVEKSVSSFAQEHLLAKEISLVLNVKRPLLERIARCTGAIVTPSTDHLSTSRLGHCEIFYLEKISEDQEPVNPFNKNPSKTLMFFEGCPRRLGCTVVLRGSCREELKKVKHMVQYAIFAAHHLLLETSFLADEGASLPEMATKSAHIIPKRMSLNKVISVIPTDSVANTSCREEAAVTNIDARSVDLNLELGLQESLSDLGNAGYDDFSMTDEFQRRESLSEACYENLALDYMLADKSLTCPSIGKCTATESNSQEECQSNEAFELEAPERIDGGEASHEYYSSNDHQCILVSYSSHCMLNGTLCERSRLRRIKFYGPSDKPLGRYLRDDLFDQSFICRSCKESAESHLICYTHQHGNLTINIRRLPSVKLPGEQDGKIWMWHKCLNCTHMGVPQATRRVVMSDAAWGLSFGKFLELSFSDHTTANRVASCGHSLQRDCLRFYGFGTMVAFFRYSPINTLSVRLPPSILEFSGPDEQIWIRKEASELLSKAESLFTEISGALHRIKQKVSSLMHEYPDLRKLLNHVLELNDMLVKEENYCKDFLQLADEEISEQNQVAVDILEINRLRHCLLIGSHGWDQRIYLLDSLLNRSSSLNAPNDNAFLIRSEDSDSYLKDGSLHLGHEDNKLDSLKSLAATTKKEEFIKGDEMCSDEEIAIHNASLKRLPSAASFFCDWIGSTLTAPNQMAPTRVYSFDSAQRLQERSRKGLPPSSRLSTLKSFHASGNYRYMVRDPVLNLPRMSSQVSSQEAERFYLLSSASPSFISSKSILPEGARLMVPQNVGFDIAITVYDNEYTSIISYALCTKEYEDWVADKPRGMKSGSHACLINEVNSLASDLSMRQSFTSLDLDYTHYRNYNAKDFLAEPGSVLADPKSSHLRITFDDESLNAVGKVKFSVTCYFAKEFDALRRMYCPGKVDFICSMSRCRRWSAQGGKSNVYFAKSFDERIIIKQVTKTELKSFEKYAPQYFKYLTDSLSSGSSTCLVKILGIYQVGVQHLKDGKEMKMDLMVMENLFYKRNISNVYDLKGSARSRYNSDTTGTNKVLLDMNLLETLHTNPIFLGSKAKRTLERAVWNDTSFLASMDVMDYSLLVGLDEERKELVFGIIDFMRQYTWDKQLETWVKASGLLGGTKNASPTIISPKQYKKRFRKAMTTYFLTIPD